MDIAHVLRDILVVLVAAKLAAELAERIGVPAVVGEIVAGILIGPSALHLVGAGDEVLRTLGEIGVILLLLDVGLEMDLTELGKVGRASVLVATVGVVTPMVLGIGAMELIGDDFKTSLFVGAALTATSVGITARVFGDLRALATTEARVVLGAAVADDVMGLVVLTVVVRLVTEGSVSVLSVAGIVALAVAFLVVGGVVGLRVAPPLFNVVERVSRSTGTLVAIALAFTLGYAELANSAKLAPIVGAFVAGIALSRSAQSGRIQRELAPVGHLFIPVFFLQIGIDAKVEAFARPGVLRDAVLLLVVAIVGKLVSPVGAIGSPGDKILIGLGMLPRGEVGLIFATIGLQAGVLDSDLYAALLLVVLVTTLIAPQLLKVRYAQIRGTAPRVSTPADAPVPQGGWLCVTDDEVGLRSRPPDHLVLQIGLEAAVLIGRNRPRADLLDWLTQQPSDPLNWDQASLERFLDVIERGNARSWRFLESTGVLDLALPELAAGFRARQEDPFALDSLQGHRLRTMEAMRRLDTDDPLAEELRRLEHLDWFLLAAVLIEGLELVPNPLSKVRSAALRLSVGPEAEATIVALFQDRELLWSAAQQPGGMQEQPVLQLASYLDTPERTRALYTFSALRSEGRERWELARLRQLYELVQSVLADPALSGSEARELLQLRRTEAARLVGDDAALARRIEDSPRAYVVRTAAPAIVRQARLLEPLPGYRDVRVSVVEHAGDCCLIEVGARDRPGLLAVVTGVLADVGLDVDDALVATWNDGAALESFHIHAGAPPTPEELGSLIVGALGGPLHSVALPEAEVSFDQSASPWHTVCEVRSVERARSLQALATAFAAAGVEVISATARTEDALVIDRFELVDKDGAKLDLAQEEAVRRYVHSGVTARRRRFRRSFALRA
jgi:Kef-type K+ transport system membrane component KefB